MERREIVQALSDYLGANPNYLGVPSFAYEIKTDEETYTIDRDGVITISAGRVVTLDEIMNSEQQEENLKALQSENNISIDSVEIEFHLSWTLILPETWLYKKIQVAFTHSAKPLMQ